MGTELTGQDGLFAILSNSKDQEQGFRYLQSQQQTDVLVPPLVWKSGSPAGGNPVYGTSKILLAYRAWQRESDPVAQAGIRWLGKPSTQMVDKAESIINEPTMENLNRQLGSSIEETALALETLITCSGELESQQFSETVEKGLAWLINRVETDKYLECSPIGFYFAKLWYHERLYPLIFTVSTLGKALSRSDASAARS